MARRDAGAAGGCGSRRLVREGQLGDVRKARDEELRRLQSGLGAAGAQQLARLLARWCRREVAQAWYMLAWAVDEHARRHGVARMLARTARRLTHLQLGATKARC